MLCDLRLDDQLHEAQQVDGTIDRDLLVDAGLGKDMIPVLEEERL